MAFTVISNLFTSRDVFISNLAFFERNLPGTGVWHNGLFLPPQFVVMMRAARFFFFFSFNKRPGNFAHNEVLIS